MAQHQSGSKKTMSSGKKKKSAVWSHFSSTNISNKMKCGYCDRICSISCGSTGNLIRHLRMRHPKIIIDKEKDNDEFSNYSTNGISFEVSSLNDDGHAESVQAVLGIENNAPTHTENPNHEVVVPHAQSMHYYILEPVDENKSKELNKQLLKMIVKELHPFTVVNNPEFKKLVNTLNPAYTLPSHKNLKNNLLPEIYQSTVAELKSTLNNVTAVALTTDKWTSLNNERYIGVTAHYLNKDFEIKSSFLSCISFPEKHSSSNIAAFLQAVTIEWELSEKVVAVVTDNVPSMYCAIRECKWQHVSCFASLLNKIVTAGLQEIRPLVEKIRLIVGHFKRNKAAQQILYEIQSQKGLPDLKMKSDVPSRWNSTFEMIARFLKNRQPLQAAIAQLQLNTFEITSSEWLIMEKAIRLLIIFNSITVEISSENTLSLSKVPYMVRFMIKHVTNILDQNNLPIEIENMANTYIEELQKYFQELEQNTVIGQSVLLDPRFKKRGFPENSFDEAYTSLCEQITSLKRDMMNEKSALNQSERHSNVIQSEFFIDIWCEFKEKEPTARNNADEAAIAELSTFINDEYLSLADSPITYWGNKLNQNKFPSLFELIKRRLCIPATAVPGQRIFTKQGNNFLEKRNSLISGKIKEILFLSQNL